MHAVVTEELAHGAARIGSQVLKGGSIRSSGRDNNAVLHGIGISKALDDLGNGGSLLANGDVDAEELLLLVTGIIETLLVDDGVDGDGGLASLTITDDQLTLATTDRHERVDGLDAGLQIEYQV